MTIEDAAELRLRQPHVVRLEARPPNARGPRRGDDPARSCATRCGCGRTGSSSARSAAPRRSTCSARSPPATTARCARSTPAAPAEALRRLETLALMAELGLPHAAVREQVADALDLVVCQARGGDGVAPDRERRRGGPGGRRRRRRASSTPLRDGRPCWRAPLAGSLGERLTAGAGGVGVTLAPLLAFAAAVRGRRWLPGRRSPRSSARAVAGALGGRWSRSSRAGGRAARRPRPSGGGSRCSPRACLARAGWLVGGAAARARRGARRAGGRRRGAARRRRRYGEALRRGARRRRPGARRRARRRPLGPRRARRPRRRRWPAPPGTSCARRRARSRSASPRTRCSSGCGGGPRSPAWDTLVAAILLQRDAGRRPRRAAARSRRGAGGGRADRARRPRRDRAGALHGLARARAAARRRRARRAGRPRLRRRACSPTPLRLAHRRWPSCSSASRVVCVRRLARPRGGRRDGARPRSRGAGRRPLADPAALARRSPRCGPPRRERDGAPPPAGGRGAARRALGRGWPARPRRATSPPGSRPRASAPRRADVMAVKAGATLVALLLALPARRRRSPGGCRCLALRGRRAGGLPRPRRLAAAAHAPAARRAMEDELADVLDLLRVAVEAGLPTGRALAEVGRRHPGLLAAELRRGGGPARARDAATRRRSRGLERALPGRRRADPRRRAAPGRPPRRPTRRPRSRAQALDARAEPRAPRGRARRARRAEDPARRRADARPVGAAAGRRAALRARAGRAPAVPLIAHRPAEPRRTAGRRARDARCKRRARATRGRLRPPTTKSLQTAVCAPMARLTQVGWDEMTTKVLQSGARVGYNFVAQPVRGGGAPPTPPPRIDSLLPLATAHAPWPSTAPSNTRSTRRTASRSRPSSAPRSPDGVVLAKGLEPLHQRCSPRTTTTALTEQALAGLNPLSAQARELKRFFYGNADGHGARPGGPRDAAGRAPRARRHRAARSSITGAGDCLEIWDRATWQDYDADLTAPSR